MSRKYRLLFIGLGLVFMVMISIPYLWANESAGGDYHFGGFLLNPIDGNSYLAKMYQGWQGSWRYSLPYTSQPGSGGYLFLFYLVLGKITRMISGSMLVVFHSARIIGSILLVISLWNFYRQTLATKRSHMLAFGLALFGSGLGWLASSFGMFTADFWVAEGFPFLSAYANPHFPIGIAILVWILSQNDGFYKKCGKVYPYLPEILWLALGVLLAVIFPFGIIITGVVLGGYGFWEFLNGNHHYDVKSETSASILGFLRISEPWRKLFFILSGGLPIMFYQLWITRSIPEFAAWSAQNLTASPSVWDLVLSYSPIILLAIPGGYFAWKSKDGKSMLLLFWAILGLLLLYFPWSLQRRFILGYLIPLAGLAAIGLDRLIDRYRKAALAALVFVVLLIIPTNLIIIFGGIQAVAVRESKILLSQEEMAALEWIESNTEQDVLVIASPQMGLFIPAYTGRRVLYGHPFETINAAEMESAVVDFFNGRIDLEKLPIARDDNLLIFYGPREQEYGRADLEREYEIVYSSKDIQIFENTPPQKTSTIEAE
jgi:hypothetical protein